jgi:succinate dehydrogenase hydrophobic anchor subunit
MIRAQRGTSVYLLRLIQRVTSVLIVVFVIALVLTGLNGYDFTAQIIENVIPFAPHRVLDIFLVSAIIIHVGVGIRFILMRRGHKYPLSRVLVIGLVVSLLFVTASLNLDLSFDGFGGGNTGNEIVWIDKTTFNFSSDEVNTMRPDLFKSGSFSMFDILVNLAEEGQIELEYHFDEYSCY